MTYISGYNIKPFSIEPDGEVLFTDGTNNSIRANQAQCEAYGYTYNASSGTCRVFNFSTQMGVDIQNIDNKIHGPGNITGTGVNNTSINGSNNIVEGFSNNGFISGRDNKIASGVNNASVVGRSGTAIREGEFVVGSNAGQTSSFGLNNRTTNATPTSLYVDGDSSVTTIAREDDVAYFFTIDVFAYRTGGASGSGAAGDRAFIKIQGMIVDVTITQTSSAIVGLGTTVGWSASCIMDGTNMKLQVTGVAAMNIKWQANATFTKMVI